MYRAVSSDGTNTCLVAASGCNCPAELKRPTLLTICSMTSLGVVISCTGRWPFAIATNTAGPPITTGNDPDAIAITPDGKTAYVVNYGSDTVTPIATASNTAGPPITVGRAPEAIAITPATATQTPAFTSSPAAKAAYGHGSPSR